MSKPKIVGMMALIVFAIGIVLVGNGLAGEKFKGRTVHSNTKWQQIDVGDEDGHVVAILESKGVATNMEGKWFGDGCAYRHVGLLDMNLKTGLGSGHYYGDYTDKDGDKWYFISEGKAVIGGQFGAYYWESRWKVVNGTGKFKGIKGGGTARWYPVGDQGYHDWECEIELPR